MPIPKHDEIRVPAMQLLIKNNFPMRLREFEIPLASHFNLSEKENIEVYESGNGPVFYDRISWALSYLNMAGLLNRPKRGLYQITEAGRIALKTPEKVNDIVKNNIEGKKKKSFLTELEEAVVSIVEQEKNMTPQERLYASFENIKESVYSDILDAILSKSPTEFESLVVKLLQRMGYGGEIKDSGKVTKASNDKGIDGVIKEDVLGFGKVYIQAKRYALDKKIGRPDLQGFYGAIAEEQSKKGIFITTCSFAKPALDYVEGLRGVSMILIDGNQLAKYIYEYGLGMQTEQTIKIKRLDSEFWDSMKDN
jgi:restriction system protein